MHESLVAHRVISLRCGIWSLSGHSGLWQAVRSADLWVHGLANFECDAISSFNPRVQLARRPLATWFDDVAQPRMRRLVVKPPQPDHGGFDRLGRTRQSMEDKGVRPCHGFGDVSGSTDTRSDVARICAADKNGARIAGFAAAFDLPGPLSTKSGPN